MRVQERYSRTICYYYILPPLSTAVTATALAGKWLAMTALGAMIVYTLEAHDAWIQ